MIGGIEKDEMGREFITSDTGVKVFVDFKDNLIVDPDNPQIARQARNWRYGSGIVKGLSCLGSEDSEDAITWNVFKTLEKSNPKRWFSELFPQVILEKDEQFIDPVLRFWDKYFPPLLRPFPEGETHVDLTVETSNKLIFIEAKYKADISKNTPHDPNRDQILTSLQNIQSANKTGLNYKNLIDYLNDKIS